MMRYNHCLTELQRELPNDRETILSIVELLFPDIDVDWNVERGNIKCYPHPNYTWVMINWKHVSFAVENHAAELNGFPVFGEISPDIYPKFHFPFKVIIFNSTKIEVPESRKKRVEKLLREKGYKKPSFKEFWREYHVD